jgi:hypothetical protein
MANHIEGHFIPALSQEERPGDLYTDYSFGGGKQKVDHQQIFRDVCVTSAPNAGALQEEDYHRAAGFEAVTVEPTRVYRVEDAREFLTGKGINVDAIAALVDGKCMSVFIRASKPQATQRPCCTPVCCGLKGTHADRGTIEAARGARPGRTTYLQNDLWPSLAAVYSSDLKLRCRVPSGASDSLRIAAQVCL